jgi:molecular chaperone IbpA
LAEHVRVIGAALENGLLTVSLKREVPEALKPRRITIGGGQAGVGQDNAPVQIEGQANAA